jgi:hypothetical protein
MHAVSAAIAAILVLRLKISLCLVIRLISYQVIFSANKFGTFSTPTIMAASKTDFDLAFTIVMLTFLYGFGYRF